VPSLAVIIPLLPQDEPYLFDLLNALGAQTHLPDEVIVSGSQSPSHIDTSLPVRFVPNPTGQIVPGLNLAIHATACDLILRMDARARPDADHIEKLFAHFTPFKNQVVGGRLRIEPGGSGLVAKAIALAVSHAWGIGDAHYRIGSQATRPVDTVAYACFPRALWQQLGGFNEVLLVNEDYEFNWRARQAGGQVLLDPAIQTVYLARHSLSLLAKQYFRYGWWKLQMLRQHPESLRWRQVLPVAALGVFVWVSVAGIAFGQTWLGGALLALYLLMTLGVSLQIAIAKRQPSLALALPWAFGCVHLAWALGAWTNLLTFGRWPRK